MAVREQKRLNAIVLDNRITDDSEVGRRTRRPHFIRRNIPGVSFNLGSVYGEFTSYVI
jgi:hypothetical protein